MVETIWREVLGHSAKSPDELISAFSLTLYRGRPGSENFLDDFFAYCELLRFVVGAAGESPFLPSEPKQGTASDAESAIPRARDRRLAYTAGGRLALVPLVARVGDVCCIIQGVDIPVVLRRTARDSHKLVGEAYIHGVMEGELMKAAVSDGQRWVSVQIE